MTKEKKKFLEKRIHEKAEERFQKNWDNFVDALKENDFINGFKISLSKSATTYTSLVNNVQDDAFFHDLRVMEDGYGRMTIDNKTLSLDDPAFSNFREFKAKKIKQYEKEETDKILDELSEVNEMLKQGADHDIPF